MSSEFMTRSELLTAGAGMPQQAPPLFDIKRMFRLRAHWMALVAVILAVPAMLAAWFLIPAQYVATSELRFLATMPRILSAEGAREQATSYEKFLNTQLSLITSKTVLQRVFESSEVRSLPFIQSHEDPLGFIESSVSVNVQRNSEIVRVMCAMVDPVAAKIVLEKLISVYMEYVFAEEAARGGERLNILTKERDARQMELQMQLQEIAKRKEQLNVPMVGTATPESREGDQYRDSLIQAETEMSKLESAIADAQWQREELEKLAARLKADAAKPVLEFGIEERTAADHRVAALREELARQESDLAGKKIVMSEQAPQRIELERRINVLRENLASVEQGVRKEVADLARSVLLDKIKGLEKSLDEAKNRVAKYQDLVKQYDDKMIGASAQLAQLAEMQRKADETRDQLQEVRHAITQINIESKAPARILLVAQASVPPGGPGHTRQLMAMVMALMGAVMVGFLVGFLWELTDQHVRSPQDVLRATRLPVIASIPLASEDRKLPPKVFMPTITAVHPDSTVADEYRRILVRLLYPEEAYAEVKTIAVTSSAQGDGKTSLACNLAIALAQAQRSVLLVDIGTRKPRLEKCFRLPRAVGLAEILDDRVAPEDAVRVTEFPQLAVLGPGAEGEELGNKLASRNMARFLEWAEREFDHVILDTPPLLLMAEAKLVAPIVDTVIVVAGVGKTTLGMLRRCLRDLELNGAIVNGVVVNGLRRTRGGYMSDNLRKYYRYGADEAEDMPAASNGRRKTPVRSKPTDVVLIPFEDVAPEDVVNVDEEK